MRFPPIPQRAVKFMYTGQLKMTKSEIDKEHLVWHVNHILLHLFRVDAKLNLPAHLLVPPKEEGGEGGGDGGEGNGEGGKAPYVAGQTTSLPSSSSASASGFQNLAPCEGARQNKIARQDEELELARDLEADRETKITKDAKTSQVNEDKQGKDEILEKQKCNANEKSRANKLLPTEHKVSNVQESIEEALTQKGDEEVDHRKENAQEEKKENNESKGKHDIDRKPPATKKEIPEAEDDIMEVEQERLPTPDIIDLLDSDDESREEAGGSLEEDIGDKDAGGVEDRDVDIPQAPRLLVRGREEEGQGEAEVPVRSVARKRTHGNRSLWRPQGSPSPTPGPSGSREPTTSPPSASSTGPSPIQSSKFRAGPSSPLMMARKRTAPTRGKMRGRMRGRFSGLMRAESGVQAANPQPDLESPLVCLPTDMPLAGTLSASPVGANPCDDTPAASLRSFELHDMAGISGSQELVCDPTPGARVTPRATPQLEDPVYEESTVPVIWHPMIQPVPGALQPGPAMLQIHPADASVVQPTQNLSYDPTAPSSWFAVDLMTQAIQQSEIPTVSMNSYEIATFHMNQQNSNGVHSVGEIYRGKVRGVGGRGRASSTPSRAVRKHHHIPWTMSGLKRNTTLAVVKQEPTIHTCQDCGVKYDKYRSLEIHRQRTHNARARVECPEGCGKLLSSTTAIRKHLLSHRPEHEWPHACPICGKRFQARGDIPKHLMTKLHEGDSIPTMGTKEWFDLIYWDDPKYDYAAIKLKLEKQEAKGVGRRVEAPITPKQEGHGVALIVHDVDNVDDPEAQTEAQEVEGIVGLEEQNFVLVDPGVPALESVYLQASSEIL